MALEPPLTERLGLQTLGGSIVIPAKAGIQWEAVPDAKAELDSRLRENDGVAIPPIAPI